MESRTGVRASKRMEGRMREKENDGDGRRWRWEQE